MSYTYKYPRPAVTVDMAVLRERQKGYELLLIRRKHDPYAGKWALPGGFVDMDETVEEAAARELYEETNLKDVALEQFHVFSKVDRDPRGRTISVIFTGFLTGDRAVKAKDDAQDARWFPLDKLPPLAFDHDEIVGMIKEKLFRQ
jgi:8-oxo-dGTP diphosphatase